MKSRPVKQDKNKNRNPNQRNSQPSTSEPGKDSVNQIDDCGARRRNKKNKSQSTRSAQNRRLDPESNTPHPKKGQEPVHTGAGKTAKQFAPSASKKIELQSRIEPCHLAPRHASTCASTSVNYVSTPFGPKSPKSRNGEIGASPWKRAQTKQSDKAERRPQTKKVSRRTSVRKRVSRTSSPHAHARAQNFSAPQPKCHNRKRTPAR